MCTSLARVSVLVAGAAGAVLQGIAYLPGLADRDEVHVMTPAESWLPIGVWGGVWITVGIVLAAAIVWPRMSITGMSLLTGLLTMWALSYLWAWGWEHVQNAWATSALFAMGAVFAGVLASILERRRR